MTRIKLILFICATLLLSCANYLDSISNLVYKENRLRESDVLFSARLSDSDRGYYTFYATKDNHFQLSILNSIPLKKGSQHLYAGTFTKKDDSLNLTFSRNHFPSGLENIIIKSDTLFIKLIDVNERLSLPIRYVTKIVQ